jgi:hypothetical protein
VAFRHRLSQFVAKPWHLKRAAIQATLRATFCAIADIPQYTKAAADLVGRFSVRRSKMPRLLLHYGLALGDNLLCTAVLREFRLRGATDVGMISNNPELFHGSEDVMSVLPSHGRYDLGLSPLSTYRHFVRLSGGEFKRLEYSRFDGSDHSAVPSRHIIAEMCASAGIAGPVAIRPYLTLTEPEKAAAVWARGRIVIQSAGMGGPFPMRNKQWYEARFQAVIDALAEEVEFIQLGSAADPLLQNANDLRGATGVRESAAILHHARLYVGTVGFLMHLARAVECPSVIIYGGREAPWQSGYICNHNLYTPLPCAPCWRWNGCEFDRKCMHEIGTADVVSAIRQMVGRPRGPLEVESIMIGTSEDNRDRVVSSDAVRVFSDKIS